MTFNYKALLTLSVLSAALSGCFHDALEEENGGSISVVANSGAQITLSGPYKTNCYASGAGGKMDTISFSSTITLTSTIYSDTGCTTGTAIKTTTAIGEVTVGTNKAVTSWSTTAPAGLESVNYTPITFKVMYTSDAAQFAMDQTLTVGYVVDNRAAPDLTIYRVVNDIASTDIPYLYTAPKNTTVDPGTGTTTGGDTFVINGTTLTESGTDPMIMASLDSSIPGTIITATSGYNTLDGKYTTAYILSIPGSAFAIPGTYSTSDIDPSGIIIMDDQLGGMLVSAGDVATVITINTAGAVGELVTGSYDATVCPFMEMNGTGGCNVATTNITGSFSVIRDADQ